MGKRGKGPPVQVKKRNGHVKSKSKGREPQLSKVSKINISDRSVNGGPLQQCGRPCEVVIEYQCKRLAEEALLKYCNGTALVALKLNKKVLSAPVPATRELRTRTVSRSESVAELNHK